MVLIFISLTARLCLTALQVCYSCWFVIGGMIFSWGEMNKWSFTLIRAKIINQKLSFTQVQAGGPVTFLYPLQEHSEPKATASLENPNMDGQ